MTAQTKTVLKSYFNTGDIPTEANFTDLVDSLGNTSVIEAKNYGVVGDGVTDDAVALQSAIDAAIAIKGILEIPVGTYVISTTLTITGPVYIRGMGYTSRWPRYHPTSATILKYTGATDAISIYGETDDSYFGGVIIEGIEIAPSVTGAGRYGILMDATDTTKCAGIYDVLLRDVTVKDFGVDGIYCKASCIDITFDRVTVSENVRYGVHFDSTGHQHDNPNKIKFNDCYLVSGRTATSWAYYTTGIVESLTFNGGTVRAGGLGNGIYITGQGSVFGVILEGDKQAGQIGIKYKSALGLYLYGCMIFQWDIAVQLGDPSDKTAGARCWYFNSYVSDNNTDIQIVDGGTRSPGTICQYGYSGYAMTVDDLRYSTDGSRNDWMWLGANDGGEIYNFTDGTKLNKNFDTEGVTHTKNFAITPGTYDTGHLILGTYHLWIGTGGKLYIKDGAPSNATDGTVVGDQTA